jgi:hypothetical protein
MKKILETLKQKWAEYLLEILVISFGILLAFGLNNWNEDRKDRILEKEYIIRLKNEMLSNLNLLEERKMFASFGIENVDRVLKVLLNDSNYSDSAQLAVAIEQIGWSVPIPHVNDVWNELINNGKIGLLKNNALRDKLSSYHTKVKETIELQDVFNQFNYGYRRIAGDILDPEIRVQIASKYGPGLYEGTLSNLPTQTYLVNELKKLNGLNGFLADIKMARGANVSMMKTAIEIMEEIIKICERELELKT